MEYIEISTLLPELFKYFELQLPFIFAVGILTFLLPIIRYIFSPLNDNENITDENPNIPKVELFK